MVTHLLCIKSELDYDGEPFCTKDRVYRIVKENSIEYVIIDDYPKQNILSKLESEEHYYGNWFIPVDMKIN